MPMPDLAAWRGIFAGVICAALLGAWPAARADAQSAALGLSEPDVVVHVVSHWALWQAETEAARAEAIRLMLSKMERYHRVKSGGAVAMIAWQDPREYVVAADTALLKDGTFETHVTEAFETVLTAATKPGILGKWFRKGGTVPTSDLFDLIERLNGGMMTKLADAADGSGARDRVMRFVFWGDHLRFRNQSLLERIPHGRCIGAGTSGGRLAPVDGWQVEVMAHRGDAGPGAAPSQDLSQAAQTALALSFGAEFEADGTLAQGSSATFLGQADDHCDGAEPRLHAPAFSVAYLKEIDDVQQDCSGRDVPRSGVALRVTGYPACPKPAVAASPSGVAKVAPVIPTPTPAPTPSPAPVTTSNGSSSTSTSGGGGGTAGGSGGTTSPAALMQADADVTPSIAVMRSLQTVTQSGAQTALMVKAEGSFLDVSGAVVGLFPPRASLTDVQSPRNAVQQAVRGVDSFKLPLNVAAKGVYALYALIPADEVCAQDGLTLNVTIENGSTDQTTRVQATLQGFAAPGRTVPNSCKQLSGYVPVLIAPVEVK